MFREDVRKRGLPQAGRAAQEEYLRMRVEDSAGVKTWSFSDRQLQYSSNENQRLSGSRQRATTGANSVWIESVDFGLDILIVKIGKRAGKSTLP